MRLSSLPRPWLGGCIEAELIPLLGYPSRADGFHETLGGSCRMNRTQLGPCPRSGWAQHGLGHVTHAVASQQESAVSDLGVCRTRSVDAERGSPASCWRRYSGTLCSLLCSLLLVTFGTLLQDGNPGRIMTPTYTRIRIRMRMRRLEATVVI